MRGRRAPERGRYRGGFRPAASPPWTPPPPPQNRTYFGQVKTTLAAYQQRDGAALEYVGSTYFMFFGWWPDSNPEWGTDVTTNSVWSSADLATWTLLLAHDPDPPTTGPTARPRRRHTFGHGQMGGYVWVIGSDGSDGTPIKSDVWRSSAPGTTWTRIAASSPWGPVYLPCIQVGYQSAIHVIGGFEGGTLIARAQHWRGRYVDGAMVWERLPDPPFARAATNPCVLDGRLIICGGSSGAEGARVRHNDTWAWNGVQWHQMSASATWSERDWQSPQVYDGRLWVSTGATPGNAGGLYVSEDGGATYTSIAVGVPWNNSHADAIAVTEADGIVIATGNNQGTSVFTYKVLPDDPSVTMPLQAWTLWFEGANYNGADTIGGKASAGSSGTRQLATVNAPTFGSINDRPTIVLDGTNEYAKYDTGGKSADILDVDGWTVVFVGKINTSANASANPFQNGCIVASGDANWAVDATSAHELHAYQFQGANKVAGPKTWSAGALVLVTARFDGINVSIRVGKGAWSNVASGNPGAIGETFFIGTNYNLAQLLGMEICELAVIDASLNDATLNLCADDMIAKWGVTA